MAIGLSIFNPSVSAKSSEPQEIPLWPDGAPGALGTEEDDIPTLTIRLAPPDKANGTAVVICPGGGYWGLAMDHEGHQVADWLNEHGVSGFIVKYRRAPKYKYPCPIQDGQRALRMVRARAKEWNVDPDRIGILGFSAGGHLASTVGTHFDNGDTDAEDPIERVSSRPDFMVLIYPVISFTTEYTHKGSRKNLLGEEPDPELVQSLSNENQVTKNTPPTFLMHANGDTGVPPENSVLFYLALRKAGVPAEMHIYQEGKHGFGLAPDDPVLSTWPARCIDWMKVNGLLESD